MTPLSPDDAAELSHVLQSQSADYLQHFHPFGFSPSELRHQIAGARRDRFWGIWMGPSLAGFFMLRGLDEGFERPSFGVFVSEDWSGHGLARMALNHAISWCREAGVKKVMLKVAEANLRARKAYSAAGFVSVDICKRTGHEVMEISLS